MGATGGKLQSCETWQTAWSQLPNNMRRHGPAVGKLGFCAFNVKRYKSELIIGHRFVCTFLDSFYFNKRTSHWLKKT